MPAKRNTQTRRRRVPKKGVRRSSNKNLAANTVLVLFSLCVLGILIAGSYLYFKKYAPTREHLALTDYYRYLHDDEAAVIINDTYAEPEEDATIGYAIVQDGLVYLERHILKEQIDDRYVFDDTEQIMRYATDKSLVSVPYEGSSYSIGTETQEEGFPIIISAYDHIFVAADFANQFSDFSYSLAEEPYRVTIYTAGFTREVASLRRKTAIRKLGGPKSKILKDVRRGDTVSVIQNHGSWSNVATEDGVIGYVQSRTLTKSSETTVARSLPQPEYTHKTLDQRIVLSWNMVTNSIANKGVNALLDASDGLNVICPTWFYINDNSGGIFDISSADYVKTCHKRNIQVWGLVSDIENRDVDVTTVLYRTSYRDRLIDNLIHAAISCGMDGINVDFEHVPAEAADGYLEFIRELSLRCKENDLFLSIDDYVPASFNLYYNRAEQAYYADYIILMAYDEHYSGDDEAGSNASLPFVKEGIESTLLEVPNSQLICGMPFYCREWLDTNGELSSNNIAMRDVADYLTKHSLTAEWDEELGQNYVEYTDGSTKHMLWIEDAQSLSRKLTLMKDYELAGSAFWLGHEPESIWTVIKEYE